MASTSVEFYIRQAESAEGCALRESDPAGRDRLVSAAALWRCMALEADCEPAADADVPSEPFDLDARTAQTGYVICSNPRSGSTYLVYLLISTGVLGVPREWLRGDGRPVSCHFPNYTRDPHEQLRHVLRDGATENGIYGLKMFPEHFDSRVESRWAQRLPNLRYVHLTRRDLLGQAISLSIARQTNSYGVWTEREREPIYDFEHIRMCLSFLARGEARWRLFFATNELSPLQLVYEDLVAAPQATVDQLATLVGVKEAPIQWRHVITKVQAEPRNTEWRERFLEQSYDLLRLGELQLVSRV